MSQLSPISNLEATEESGLIVLSWDPVEYAEYYIVESKQAGQTNWQQIGIPEETTLSIQEPLAEVTYNFRITASGEGYEDGPYGYINVPTSNFYDDRASQRFVQSQIRSRAIKYEDILKFGSFLWGKPESALNTINKYLPPTVQ